MLPGAPKDYIGHSAWSYVELPGDFSLHLSTGNAVANFSHLLSVELGAAMPLTPRSGAVKQGISVIRLLGIPPQIFEVVSIATAVIMANHGPVEGPRPDKRLDD